ncbi:VOC family protein [Nocardioides sp. 31GB23]|uniref:VOC family protein n=1 Tax=Nocardioides sp. 31GB23 TaxID=3156065 RepID=UPI0032AF2860
MPTAYGDTGVWQRWSTYAATLHGGNVGLKELVDEKGEEYYRTNMRFALLEYWSMRTDHDHVLERESYWKDVLHARSLGHNKNWSGATVPPMPIKLENVGIAVRDLDATIAFFTDLGLTLVGRDTVSGEWADTAVSLDGNHAHIAMLQTPDGSGRLELFEYIHPDAIETDPTRPHEIGMHRVAFSVDDIDEALEIAARHGCHPLRGVATYGNVYKLTYLRGPSGIIVMLAEALQKD